MSERSASSMLEKPSGAVTFAPLSSQTAKFGVGFERSLASGNAVSVREKRSVKWERAVGYAVPAMISRRFRGAMERRVAAPSVFLFWAGPQRNTNAFSLALLYSTKCDAVTLGRAISGSTR